MLSFVFDNNFTVEWDVDYQLYYDSIRLRAHQCTQVTASDSSIHFIIDNFINLQRTRQWPGAHRTGLPITWYGDDAKFIAGNI